MSSPEQIVKDPARTLAEVAKKRGAGILSAARGKHKRMICMRGGRLIFVASNVIEEQLEAYMVAKGLVDAAAMKSLEKEARSVGQRPSLLLLQRREISPEVLYEAAADRTRLLAVSTIEWSDGAFTFVPGNPKLDGELTVDISFAPLMFEHALRLPNALPEVRERIGPPEQRLRRSETGKQVLSEIELNDSARAVLEFSDGFLTATEIVARVRGSSEGAWRGIHALLSIGALRPVAAGEVPKVAVGEAVSREEMLARLARDDRDHYSVLGLTAQASNDEIRDAYYYLARRYHPDRHRTGEMKDLLDKIESFFTKVTEAYNTLIDPALRAQYDEENASQSTAPTTEPQQDTRHLAQQNFARGMLLVKKKQLHDALRFLENAIELNPSKAEYHLELGCLLQLNPRSRDEAEKVLLKAVELNPALSRAYLTLGDLYERGGRADEALEMFEEALRWEPHNVEVSAAVARLAAAAKRKGLFGG